MPLVGVPSFVEFSQQHSRCYFFVTVRKAKDLDSHRLPTSAFEEAANAEPWTPAHDTRLADPEAPPTPENGEVSIQRKPSVTLPYNDDVRFLRFRDGSACNLHRPKRFGSFQSLAQSQRWREAETNLRARVRKV